MTRMMARMGPADMGYLPVAFHGCTMIPPIDDTQVLIEDDKRIADRSTIACPSERASRSINRWLLDHANASPVEHGR
jgi:hypothetical protein